MAAFAIVVASMKAAATIIVPFLLAVFISIIAGSPLIWLRHKGLPMWLSLSIIILIVIGVMLLLVFLLGASLEGFTRELPNYYARLREILLGMIRGAQEYGLEISENSVREVLDPTRAIGIADDILSGLTNLLGNTVLILLTITFILVESASFPTKLLRIVGHDTVSTQKLILARVRKYIAVKTIISAATGTCIGILALLVGLDFPFLWAMLGFLLNYVPTIGSIIAGVPACLIALVQLGIWPMLATAVGYFAINTVFGNLIEPRVMGRTMGLSTLVVFLSLVFWGWVLGPIGMLLSVPLTMVAKIILEQNENTLPIAILLDSEKV